MSAVTTVFQPANPEQLFAWQIHLDDRPMRLLVSSHGTVGIIREIDATAGG